VNTKQQNVLAHNFIEGYDSDVEREKSMDYQSKIYTKPIQEREGVKPHLQETAQQARWVLMVMP